ncbi:conserved protein of unknown function [Methylorubrum extorquens]|uniref:Uncharacterized protein n=1 Tax=Methylorubrum extorquens TaxID=408 RepID=A0A2N9AN67_METEX|nr:MULTISPECIES: hypothetical protein [Methylorubrum]ARO57100.1 hypothetical protein B2G69_24995 [Methylorubrum zatmanii]KQO91632.1 hypothetical protein ASF36_19015 [Methylobacterium sp. Leaf90]WHQ71983.1 hypothetical protein KEC54_10755 [Methylorubrum extorquens]SOR28806.1 conserved protein of unknown function [Methylorubrum extorquens]
MLHIISPEDRRAAERDRRIARARAEARPSAQALVAEAGRAGNGGPPMLASAAEIRAIGELLYGRRWTTELAEALGEDPRQVRRWLSGEAAVPDRAVRWSREAARRRAREILALVGDEA